MKWKLFYMPSPLFQGKPWRLSRPEGSNTYFPTWMSAVYWFRQWVNE